MGALVWMRRISTALLLAIALLLAAVAPGQAQQPQSEEAFPWWVNWLNDRLPFGLNVTSVDIEGGYRTIGDNRSSAKFQEYRVLEESPFLDHARISLETKDQKQYIEFSSIDSFKQDQSYLFRFGKYGGYELEIFWDQVPHLLSTTGRTLFTTTREDGNPNLTLPSGVASTVQAATPATRASVLAGFLANATPTDLSFLTSKAGFGFKYNLTDSLDFGVRYTFTQKDGTIPFGAGFSSPGGNVVEIPAPLFNRTHQVEVKTQYAQPGWNVGLGYTASIFDQSVDNITFDNPLSATNSPTLSARGLTTMDPSNQAHNVFLSGGLSLPLQTRVTGKVSYGWRLQDESFVSHTINPALAANPGLVLPRSSFDGDIRTTLVALNATSRPLTALPLTLYGGYRFYDFNNRSPEIVFPAHTVRDTSLTPDAEVNAPFSYTKHNAHLDAGYPILSDLHFKMGYEWERWDRNSKLREVPTSDEHSLKTSLDFTPIDWLLFRAAYRRGWRRIDNYVPQAHDKHVTVDIEGEPWAPDPLGQSVLLRKFDEADRNRDRVEILTSISPIENLSFTATYSLLQDHFNNSDLGLQKSRGWSAGGDLAYSPFKWLSFFVNYTREEFRYDQLSRSRPVTGTTAFDFTDFNWRSVNTDTIDTYGVGTDVSLIPNRLNFRLTYTFSDADTIMRSFNPVKPTSGTGAQRATATAVDYPLANTNLHTLIAALRYNLTRNWSLKGEYRFEQFRETDWATDAIGQSGLTNLPPTTDTFLGARFLQNYDAHIAAFTLRYQF
ncbi:MtrB/PioB family decaheme-associated outer membrane protein [Candidatus Methylomirabilis sp.]|uniref:MtrB/PioB family decaheme-associated outer membrane protein n=1 Tax=Candidatus Methylomirabilis sp. TaxID=2032687 RepID=UPI002A5C550D|nr:MtrB/PioB family decaheme-associated outer membrane protein [Candidatus Methylomirabilis sp.]